jgi:putative molybdopterin biosynthesis protein
MAETGNAVSRARIARGLTQVELAARAGISRQALGAIESGVYRPNVAVALVLARELGQTVEHLFGDAGDEDSRLVEAQWIEAGAGERAPRVGAAPRRVALARVGGKVVAMAQPAAHLTLGTEAGILRSLKRRRAEVSTLHSSDEIDAALLVAGCDPAIAILADWLARRHSPARAMAIPCSSGKSLRLLVDGCAHAAGVHLRDPRTGEYNLPQAARALKNRPALIVNFGQWELGLATAAGNPLALRGFDDLGRPGLRIVNRESGSGAREALDAAIVEHGLAPDQVAGYAFEVGGHLEVAAAIAAGQADVGVTIRVAADTFGLGFIALREERYDLVVLENEAESPPVKILLDALNSDRFAREVSQLCAYDTARMGQVIARVG